MKITPFRPYPAAGVTGAARVGTVEKSMQTAAFAEESAQNVDKLDLSGAGPRGDVEKTAWSLARQVSRPASAQRLQQLRTAVQDGTYYVPSGQVADAILSWGLL